MGNTQLCQATPNHPATGIQVKGVSHPETAPSADKTIIEEKYPKIAFERFMLPAGPENAALPVSSLEGPEALHREWLETAFYATREASHLTSSLSWDRSREMLRHA